MITIEINVHCDIEDCFERFRSEPLNVGQKFDEILEQAESKGWTFENGKQFCPHHKPATKEVA